MAEKTTHWILRKSSDHANESPWQERHGGRCESEMQVVRVEAEQDNWVRADKRRAKSISSFACDGDHCECNCVNQRQAETFSTGVQLRSAGGLYAGSALGILDADSPRRRSRWRSHRVP
jgi:hypothetical protein